MPEIHDTDFNWSDFVEKINSELIAAYGNFVHRVLTLGARLPIVNGGPFAVFDNLEGTTATQQKLEEIHASITKSLSRHRYKEALRFAMNAAQVGNQLLQSAAPWKYLSESNDGSNPHYDDERKSAMASLAFGWRISRF